MAQLLTESMKENWKEILDDSLPNTTASNRRDVVTVMLEHQKNWCTAAARAGLLTEASSAPNSTYHQAGSSIDSYSPVLIKMARRLAPSLIAMDLMGTQPLNAPDGLIFALRSRYGSPTGPEALLNEPNTGFSGDGTANAGDQHGFPKGHVDTADLNDVAFGKSMDTQRAELLGTAGVDWSKMAFSIEKSNVSAKSRGLFASYSLELAQDMAAVHGENVDNILTDILTTEIAAEMNREFVKTILTAAVLTDRHGAEAGKLDVASELEGRWSLERWKLLLFVIELESNQIGVETRRGKGNTIVCSADFASMLRMTGLLDYTPALNSHGAMEADVTGPSFVGRLVTGHSVHVDPYATITYYCVGYKGMNQQDAGIFFAPYTPLEMFRSAGEDTLSDMRVGYKTRYGLVANPFVSRDAAGVEKPGKGLGQSENVYYRKCWVTSIM